MKTKFAIVASTFFFTGCVPMSGDFLRLEHKDATYIQEACYGQAGAPRIVFFPYNGIYLSVAIYPGEVVFGVHVPEGQTVQLLDQEIEVTFEDPQTKAAARLALQPVRHNRLSGNSPYVFNYPDPFEKEDYFGLLSGGTREVHFMSGASKTAYKWYEFSAKFDLSRSNSGSIRLPPMNVNGVKFQELVLPFKKDHYFEMPVINC